jgi:N6-L-threonylcarbamoyladenine synthase
VFAGGVMSNRIIRDKIAAKLSDVWFSEPAFSADNAAGIALLAARAYRAGR